MPESKQNTAATGASPDGTTPSGADAALRALSGGALRVPSAADEAYDIRIGIDGTWYYHGSPIGRLPLVRLFATVLRRDDAGDFWLITPAERGRIIVDDAPFIAVEMRVEGAGRDQHLIFRTSLDAEITAGPDHPIHVVTDPVTREPRPYIRVRGSETAPLNARINRVLFYDLVERAEAGDDGDGIGVWSQGVFFALGRVDDN